MQMPKHIMIHINFCCLVAFAPAVSIAAQCHNAPAAATVSVDELVRRSPRIVLVAVETPRDSDAADAKDPGITLNLEAERRKVTEDQAPEDRANPAIRVAILNVVEELKGHGSQRIYRPNLDSVRPQHDFDAHRDAAFWDDDTIGLVRYDEECRQQMSFEPGSTYLLFEGPAHVKGAELIESQDDAWLVFVRKKLAK